MVRLELAKTWHRHRCRRGLRWLWHQDPNAEPFPALSRKGDALIGAASVLTELQPAPGQITAVTRARARHRPITLRDLLGRSPRTHAGGQNTVLMPGAGSGILKTWRPTGARSSACAPPWTCTT